MSISCCTHSADSLPPPCTHCNLLQAIIRFGMAANTLFPRELLLYFQVYPYMYLNPNSQFAGVLSLSTSVKWTGSWCRKRIESKWSHALILTNISLQWSPTIRIGTFYSLQSSQLHRFCWRRNMVRSCMSIPRDFWNLHWFIIPTYTGGLQDPPA